MPRARMGAHAHCTGLLALCQNKASPPYCRTGRKPGDAQRFRLIETAGVVDQVRQEAGPRSILPASLRAPATYDHSERPSARALRQ